MGVGNTVADYMGELLGSCSSSNRRKMKKRAVQSAVELKVRMCCDGCELKVHNALSSMQGVDRVDINRKQQKVTVVGRGVEAGKVAKATGKKCELWPYVPYTLLSHLPYIPLEAYDKKAPPGYVRNLQQFNVSSSSSSSGGGGGGSSKLLQLQDEQQYVTVLFSDENPNSCSIM